MKHRKWVEDQATIVLEGLKGKLMGTICPNNLSGKSAVRLMVRSSTLKRTQSLEVAQQTERAARLQHEKAGLRTLMSELILGINKRPRGVVMSCVAPRRSASTMPRCWLASRH